MKGQKSKAQNLKPEGKFNKLHSIKVKVNILMVVGILIAVGVTLGVLMNYMQELVIDSAYGKMLNTITTYGKIIDGEESEAGDILAAESYGAILKDMKVEGVENYYYYVIDKSGIIRYHQEEAQIGKPNKNKVITALVGNLNKGVVPDNLCAEFEENGVKQYASYYVTGSRSVVVVCADGNELMKPIRELMMISLALTLIIVIAAIIISNIIVSRITKPLWQISNIINDTAKLKLKIPDNMNKLCTRKDETGMMSRAVREMSENLHEVVHKIE